MQIVFNREVAEQLRERYTVLELETFKVDEREIDTFCVVPAEKLAFMDLSKLDEQKADHATFINAVRNNDWRLVIDFYDTVHGMFGGEVDSFYDIMLERAKKHLT